MRQEPIAPANSNSRPWLVSAASNQGVEFAGYDYYLSRLADGMLPYF
jgi:hypothetical protein